MTEEEYTPSGADTVDEDLAQLTDTEHQARTDAYLAGLQQYDLEEEDQAILAGFDDDEKVEGPDFVPPVVAIVGRPNVGKSTLVNRIIGRRAAVVEDTPGVTRDRVRYPAEWNGVDFILMDTGGWESKTRGIDRHVAQQSEYAITEADVIILVVDAMVGATATDEQLLKLIRASKKPAVLVGNKVDDPRHSVEVAALWNLGLGEPSPVSAIHGLGTGAMLDRVVEVLPDEHELSARQLDPRRRIALVG